MRALMLGTIWLALAGFVAGEVGKTRQSADGRRAALGVAGLVRRPASPASSTS